MLINVNSSILIIGVPKKFMSVENENKWKNHRSSLSETESKDGALIFYVIVIAGDS